MSRSSHVTAPHLSSPLKLTDCEGGTSSRRVPGHEAATAARDGQSCPDAGQHRHRHQHPRVTEALPVGCALAGSFSQTAHLWVPSCRIFFFPFFFSTRFRHCRRSPLTVDTWGWAKRSSVRRIRLRSHSWFGSPGQSKHTHPHSPVLRCAASLPLCLSAPLSEEGHFTTAEYK